MAHINAFTGLKRKKSRRDVPRKKRDSLCSTVAARMYATQAMDSFEVYMAIATLGITACQLLLRQRREDPALKEAVRVVLLSSAVFFARALEMLLVDHYLMDVLPETVTNAGFLKPLEEITLYHYDNDDECQSKTRLKKDNIRKMIEKVGLGPEVRVYYGPATWYKFNSETLVIYMLRKMATSRTHADLADSEFGGCAKRWGTGYKFIVHRFDRVFAPLIGPTGLRAWAPCFPYFAECIRDYICRAKERVNKHGKIVEKGLQAGWISPPRNLQCIQFY
jgi:hypothetical protein